MDTQKRELIYGDEIPWEPVSDYCEYFIISLLSAQLINSLAIVFITGLPAIVESSHLLGHKFVLLGMMCA